MSSSGKGLQLFRFKMLYVLQVPRNKDIESIHVCMMLQTRQDGKALAVHAVAAMMSHRMQTAWAKWRKHTAVRVWKYDKKSLAAASCCEHRLRCCFQALTVRQQVAMHH